MKRNTLVLIGLFVVLVLIVVLGERPFGDRKKPEGEALFPGFDSSAVAVIEVRGPVNSTRLEKVDGAWRVVTEDGYPADGEAVGQLLARVRDLRRGEVASRNPEKQSLYEVGAAGLEAHLWGPDEKDMAHFIVGKSGPGYSGAYVRKADSDEVILVGGYLRGMFDKGDRGWRDRTIFDFDPEQAFRFRTERPDTVYTVSTADKIRWYVSAPDSCEAKMNVVDNILRTVSTLRADDFDTRIGLEAAGLVPPWGRFTVKLSDGTEQELLVGKKDKANNYWVKRADRDMVFKVRDFRIQTLFPTLETLKAPPQAEGEPEGEPQS